MDTLEAMLVTEVNYDETCVETSLRKFTTLKNTAALLLVFKVRMTTVSC
jgi:hypothetical protein